MLIYILIAIFMIGLLIALHELGHFIAAKACGVKVNEFSIGMGPCLIHRQGKETDYSLRALPVGGFCAMEGEEEGDSPDPRAFPNRPWWQRLIILLAGVAVNFLTGFLILLFLFSTSESFVVPTIQGFTEGWNAQEQGLQAGDRILEVDGHDIYQTADISLFLTRSKDGTVDLTLERDGKRMTLFGYRFFGVENPETGKVEQYYLGVNTTVVPNTPAELLRQSWSQSIDYVRMVWISLGDLFTGQVGVRDMSGIAGMTVMMGELGEEGAAAAEQSGQPAILGAMFNILSFVAFIAINLSVMNLLPIPALDGGQILLMAINGLLLKVRGRKLDPKYQGWVSAASLIALMGLILLVNISDVLKMFGV